MRHTIHFLQQPYLVIHKNKSFTPLPDYGCDRLGKGHPGHDGTDTRPPRAPVGPPGREQLVKLEDPVVLGTPERVRLEIEVEPARARPGLASHRLFLLCTSLFEEQKDRCRKKQVTSH